MADNLKTQLEINKAIQERQLMLAKQTDELQKQLNISKQIFAINKNLAGTSLDDVISQLEEMKDALEEVRETSEKTYDDFTEQLRKSIDKSDKFSDIWKNFKKLFVVFKDEIKKTDPILFAFLDGFGKGLSFTFNIFKSLTGLFATAVQGIFELSLAILAIPFKFLEGMFALANKMTAMWVENAKAVEEIRKQFGDLARTTGGQVMKAFRGLQGVMGNFGMSMYSIFGTVAERLQYVNELFKGMGSIVHSFDKEMSSNITTIGFFQKGLGLTSEQLGDVGIRAKSMGTTLSEQLRKVANFSFKLGERFGISGKIISRTVGEMIKDVGHFGTLSVKKMAESATYTKSLGLEIKALSGVVDKFLNFEDAALSAAKLSQVFGAQVDVMKQMRLASTDPAKALSNLQEAFFKTGRSADQLGLAELRFLAKTTGLTEQEAKLAFSLKARGKSLEDIKKVSSDAGKNQLTLEGAVSKVAASIERLVKPLPQFKGFFDAFLQGFTRGFLHSKDFHKSLQDLYFSAFEVARGAMQMGKAFMDSFPGVNQFWKGFQKLFNPKEIRKLMKNFMGVFDEFILMLKDPNQSKGALDFLTKSIQDEFNAFFEINNDMKSGFKTFATTIRDLIVQSAPLIVGGVADLLLAITGAISNPEQYADIGKSGVDGVSSFLGPIILAFKKAADNKDLWIALKGLAMFTIDKLVEFISIIAKEYPWGTAFVILGPAILSGFTSMLGTMFTNGLIWLAQMILPLLSDILLPALWTGFKAVLRFVPWIALFLELGHTIGRIIKKWDVSQPFIEKFILVWRELRHGIFNLATLGLSHIFPQIHEFIDKFYLGIENYIRDKWKDIGKMWDDGKKYLSSAFDGFKLFIAQSWENIKKTHIKIFNGIWSVLKESFPLLKLVDLLKQENFEDQMKNLGKSMVDGLKVGFEKVKDLLPDSLTAAIEVVKQILEARSPSRVFMEFGKNMSDGLNIGMQTIPQNMDKIMTNSIKRSQNKFHTGLSQIHNMSKQLERNINSVPNMNLNARLDEGLKVKNQKIEIKHKDLNLSINLNVLMDADQIASAIVKTKKVVSTGRPL